MPTYRVTAPDGRSVRLTGDSPPTEQELEEVFSRVGAMSGGQESGTAGRPWEKYRRQQQQGDMRGLLSDPRFQSLPQDRKRAVLERTGADPRFIDELLAGASDAQSASRQFKYPNGTVSPTGKYVVQGGKWVPRDEAASAEPGGYPAGYRFAETLHRDDQGRTLSFPHMAVPAESEARGNAMLAATLPLGSGALSAAGRIPGAIGAAARAIAARPMAAGAAVGAAPELGRGDIPGAVKAGTIGALIGASPVAKRLLRTVGRWGTSTSAPMTRAAPVARGVSTTGTVPASVPTPTIADLINAAARTSGSTATAAAQKVAEAAPAGKAFNTIWREFAKATAPTAKRGERVWLKLNEEGIPVDVITPSQAGRLPDRLKTFVRRTW